MSYDPNGVAVSNAFGSSSETGMAYDADGEMTGGTVNQPGLNPGQVSNYYNLHGELANSGGGFAQSADGVFVHNNAAATNWDPRNGVLLYMAAGSARTITYDAAGRQTGETNQRSSSYTDIDGDLCSSKMTSGSGFSRSFDVENHNVTTTLSSSSQQSVNGSCTYTNVEGRTEQETYGWGPTGHPVAISWQEPNVSPEPSGIETLHWDGDSLLFTSNATSLGKIFLGDDGFYGIGGTGFSLTPRDISGSTFSACAAGVNDYYSCAASSPDPFPSNTTTVTDFTIYKNRSDGIDVGNDVIQGTRSYNSDTLSWTTPDAYDGDLADPITQQRYVWNRNNPITYQDPSGYMFMEPMGGGDGIFVASVRTAPGPSGTDPHVFEYAFQNGMAFALMDWAHAHGGKEPISEAEAWQFLEFAIPKVQQQLQMVGIFGVTLNVTPDRRGRPLLQAYYNGEVIWKAYVDYTAHGGRMYGGVEVNARVFGTRNWAGWIRLDYSEMNDDVFYRIKLTDMPLPWRWPGIPKPESPVEVH